MKSNLLTQNIWQEITSTTKKCKTVSHVAVAYFGQGAAKMLPLKVGSRLVVDASEGAVKSGQTSPKELIDLYKKGVEIYSHQNLHAKVFVIGSKIFIGSANVSSRSSNLLQEAVITSTDSALIRDSKQFITGLCKNELGLAWLRKLKRIYVRPKVNGGKRTKGKRIVKDENNPSVHVYHVDAISDYEEKYHSVVAAGRKEAASKKKLERRHVRDEFLWEGSISLKEGDSVLQIVKESTLKTFVCPIARVIHIKKLKDKTGAFIYLEVPNKKRKDINLIRKYLTVAERHLLGRNGKRNSGFANKIIALWN